MPPSRTLPSILDHLADRGEHWLLRSRLRDALKASLPRALTWMVVVALIALVASIGHAWIGTPLPSLWILVLLSFGLPLGYMALRVFAVLREHPTREEALAVYDQRLGLEDRLQTADAFLRRSEQTAFTEAAVADAMPAAQRAVDKDLYWSWGENAFHGRMLLMPLLALLCLLGAFLLPRFQSSGPPAVQLDALAESTTPISETSKPPAKRDPAPQEQAAKSPPQVKSPKRVPKGAPPSVASEPNATERMVTDDEVKETEGMTEGGQHSDAKSSGRSDRSQGAPGNQSPASKPVAQTKPKKKSPKKNEKKEKSSKPTKKVKDRSGATSGRGSSSGSSRNPASTDWSSKDRVEETEAQEMEQEDDVDDEETESEARGGLQPNLRDRRPPVNRDLAIGFGNRSNPDANGRGGPGQRKKSRGVASLVLGVPVPDHVKGQANPGRVKITQERIQPKAERSEPVAAEERGERQSPYGTIPQRTMEPWMKRLVRDYFERELKVEN